MIDELELVKQARPDATPPSQEVRAKARRALEQAMEAPRRTRGRRRAPWRFGARFGALAPALGVLVVAAVVVVFLAVHGRKAPSPAAPGGARLVFSADLTARPAPATVLMARTVAIVRERLAAALPGSTVSGSASADQVVVRLASSTRADVRLAVSLVEGQGRLLFYDWEANVLTPSGAAVAGRLQAQDPVALAISQGQAGGPGEPGVGAMSLFRAVQLAQRSTRAANPHSGNPSMEWFAFGAPASPACATAARYYRMRIASGPCYLAGPAIELTELQDALPPGLNMQSVRLERVWPGLAVVRATPPRFFGGQLPWSDPAARYYVLRDYVALSGDDVVGAHASTDQGGAPDVQFGFSAAGARKFQALTARIAHRGERVSGFGQQLHQHFAVTLDDQILTVPQIDYKIYPDGIPGDSGADITGPFTAASARLLATVLRDGPLPLRLVLVSANGRR
jgi:SecD/SecF fusion protein